MELKVGTALQYQVRVSSLISLAKEKLPHFNLQPLFAPFRRVGMRTRDSIDDWR
jgi:hypothetical protein